MKWLELTLEAPSEYVEPLAEIFRRYGHGGVAVEQTGGWDPDIDEPPLATSALVRTYLPMTPAWRSQKGMIEVGVRLVSLLHRLGPLQERVIEEREWEEAWKAHFTLLRVGRRIVIKPSWQEYASRPRDAVVELDPGLAFGTGHHPTTRMCLEEAEVHLTPGQRVLDLGTGSAILTIAAAKLGASHVLALDIDALALRAARRNVRANGVHQMVTVRRGTLPHRDARREGFHLALANINGKVIVDKASALARVLAPGGTLVASGLLEERRQEAEQALEKAGLVVVGTRSDGDWVALIAHREREVSGTDSGERG